MRPVESSELHFLVRYALGRVSPGLLQGMQRGSGETRERSLELATRQMMEHLSRLDFVAPGSELAPPRRRSDGVCEDG